MPVVEASQAPGRTTHRAAPDRPQVARVAFWALAAVVAPVAFATRIGVLLQGGGLRSWGNYDDGVYYAAADALVHGRMPYREFLFLHPPGVTLAIAPFAWVGSLTSDSLGLAAGRVGFEVVGAMNAVLVAVLLRRKGLAAAAVGGLMYAVFYPAAYAERSTLIEPLGTFATLLGLVLLLHRPMRTRWATLAGVPLGATLGVKIWYVVPTAVVLLVGALALRGRFRWALLAGAGVGAGALYVPFFAAAPGRMWRYVVTDQVGRAGAPLSDLATRARSMLGVPGRPAVLGGLQWLSPLVATLVVAAVAFVLVLVALRDVRTLSGTVFVALLAADTGVLLLSPSFFLHYASLTAAPLALVTGTAVGVLARHVRPPLAAGIAAVVLVAVGAFEFPLDHSGVGRPMPGARMQAAVARIQGCVMADDPTILALTDTLSRNLDRGCPLWPDVTGWTYDARYAGTGREQPQPRRANAEWQAGILRYLTSGDASITSRPDTGISRQTQQVLARGRLLARSHGIVLRATPRA